MKQNSADSKRILSIIQMGFEQFDHFLVSTEVAANIVKDGDVMHFRFNV